MAENLKVLQLTESFNWSGGAAQILALSKGLKDKGVDVAIACPEGGGLWSKARDAGINVFDFRPSQDYDVGSALKISGFVASEKIAVVHAHHPKAHAVGLMSKFFVSKKPVFVVSRRVSHPMRFFNPFSKWKYLSRKIDGYVAVAEAVGAILAEFGIPREKIEIIYSGVDENRFYPRQPDKKIISGLRLPAGVPVIGIIGNYSRDKGQEIFFRSAADVLGRGIKAVFVSAGRDTDSGRLRAFVKDLGLRDDDVRLLGFREDVPEIISVLDISVNAAVGGEALSGSMRESLAMSVPVIASDLAGNSELIKPGLTGGLFPPGDWKALSELIVKFTGDRRTALAMAAKVLEFVRENLTVSKMVQKTLDYYLRLAAARRLPPS